MRRESMRRCDDDKGPQPAAHDSNEISSFFIAAAVLSLSRRTRGHATDII